MNLNIVTIDHNHHNQFETNSPISSSYEMPLNLEDVMDMGSFADSIMFDDFSSSTDLAFDQKLTYHHHHNAGQQHFHHPMTREEVATGNDNHIKDNDDDDEDDEEEEQEHDEKVAILNSFSPFSDSPECSSSSSSCSSSTVSSSSLDMLSPLPEESDSWSGTVSNSSVATNDDSQEIEDALGGSFMEEIMKHLCFPNSESNGTRQDGDLETTLGQQQQHQPQQVQENHISLVHSAQSDASLPTIVGKIKQAKSKDNEYGNVPSMLLCNPYKYDLKLIGDGVGKLVTDKSERIEIQLVEAESMQMPNVNKELMSLDSVIPQSQDVAIFRITINICSFHIKRKSLRILLVDVTRNKTIFTSSAFQTFARKRGRNAKNPNKDNGSSCKKQRSDDLTRQPPRINALVKHEQAATITKQQSSPRHHPFPAPVSAIPPTPLTPGFSDMPTFEKLSQYQQQLQAHMNGSHDSSVNTKNGGDGALMASLERTSRAIKHLSCLSAMEFYALQTYMQCQMMAAHQEGKSSM